MRLSGFFGSQYLAVSREDLNDAERLRQDRPMRWIVGGKATSQQGIRSS
jgi:hypothetical protein